MIDEGPAPEEVGARGDADPYRVAVVGSGPRGIAVLERLAARLAARPPARPVELHVLDAVEVGCGRIWRTDQPSWFMMNTVAGEVTMFSGPADGRRARPGHGPTLAQWWASVDPDCPGPDGYAPRALYGRYLRFVLDTVEAGLPASVALHRLRTEVVDLVPDHDGYLLATAGGTRVRADRVLLATGHPRPRLDTEQQRLADFAATRPGLRYLRGDSASDMPLGEIQPGETVGVVGLGLSFYDVMVALTIGRGGRFEPAGEGRLRFVPSGEEPVLVAGSRAGVPILARGRNQKTATHTYTPRVFTTDRVRELRRAGRIDLRADLIGLLETEMRLVYYATALRLRFGAEVAERFTEQAVAAAGDGPARDTTARLAAAFGVDDLPELDLHEWSRPLEGRWFADPELFHAELLDLIDADLRDAEAGTVDGPRKAACDVLRDTRQVLREAVDFAGLTPASHRFDLVEWFTPLASFLAAGPPLVRLRQVRALIECGVLRVLGPSVRFGTDPAAGRFAAWSPRVGGSRVLLDGVLDARIPQQCLWRDTAELTRRLHARGLLTSFVNTDGGTAFDTGGAAVTQAPYHPVGTDGQADPGIYVLGIPTEHTRWFTQVGSGRPGRWTAFTRDADAIAEDVLSGVASGTRHQTPAGAGEAR
ncbi:FAD/NAD(P)-binding protein [Actinophytocola xanthii]|uniref:FAD-dependent urate hydroxylase HpyO/Asp monooxygenase CreE-like FAD/NAD(P)-binding domain-containing protein n=1 Tax=Actinophytocola xanthii TaxID=1912961 RepID=A0A1Q8CJZ8_9PSEU|nr:FAD/NAD(P)-binding protein [Actinophytocola xanthii]OLF14687.1 hypothetical protein BU204_25690 [Actinophytocola xanthii]